MATREEILRRAAQIYQSVAFDLPDDDFDAACDVVADRLCEEFGPTHDYMEIISEALKGYF